MEFDTIIRGGDVVIPKRGIQRLDIGVRDGRVAALMADASGETGEVIDAAGHKGWYLTEWLREPATV